MSAPTQLTAYPLNIYALTKGQWLSPVECGQVLGVSPAHEDYRLRLLDLRDKIKTLWLELRGEVITIVTLQGGLKIHTDETAVRANNSRFEQVRRRARRTLFDTLGVDRAKLLSVQDREDHELLARRLAGYVLGGKRGARLGLKPHMRQTPALMGKKNE